MTYIALITIGVLILDLASKQWAVNALQNAGKVEVIPFLLDFQLAYNEGMALGMFSGSALASLLLPLVVMGIGFLVMKRYHLTRYTCIACGLILSGFLGNFLERIVRGYVVDMIYFPFLPFFICNIADIAITAGVVMFMISLLCRPKDWREKHAKDHHSRHAE